MLCYGFAFANDLERLREVIKRINRSPLGCGALAGNPFGIDRDMMAEELGFEGILWNSMGAVADRDFVSETLQWGSMLMQHISRWAEDLIITPPPSSVSSASPMPTPPAALSCPSDSLERLRGKSGRAFGQMAGLMIPKRVSPAPTTRISRSLSSP